MVEFVSLSIVLYSFLTLFILSRSIIDSDIYGLPEPVSKSALHLTPVTFVVATGYDTLASVVIISSELLSANLSHLDVWCLFLNFKQVVALQHSVALCLAPVQLKQSFLLLNIFLHSVTVFQFYNQKIYGQVSHSIHIHS